MASSAQFTKRTQKVVINRPPEGGSPKVSNSPPEDAPVKVAVDSLEANVGYGSLLAQLKDAVIKRIAFFRSKEGGGFTWEEAQAKATDYCENQEEVEKLYSELMAHPVSDIRFIDLAKMWNISPSFSEYLWEGIKNNARDEFESGHLAANNTLPGLDLRRAWRIASYLGLRESFAAEWQPQGGIQLSLIDMLAQSFLQYQHWVEESVRRSKTRVRMHTQGYIQWQERFHADPIDDGYTKGDWNMPYVSEQVAIEHAVQMADRWHRIFMRTLRNLRDFRRYSVTINNPQQVNIAGNGGKQVNVAQ